MKFFLVIFIWGAALLILIAFYKKIIEQILKLNKGLIEIIDFTFADTIKRVISHQEHIIDFEKTLKLLEEEKEQLLNPPYTLNFLEKLWNNAYQQQKFVDQLLRQESKVNKDIIWQLLKITRALCKAKKFVETLLILLTLGMFIGLKNRIIRGVYVYC